MCDFLHRSHRTSLAAVSLACLMVPGIAVALPPAPPGIQVTETYGLQFSTITHAGNRLPTPAEAPAFYFDNFPPFVRGSVGYDFRITRTEITNAQWFEFVQAYAPFYQGSRLDSNFTGSYIAPTSLNPSEPARYRLATGTEQYAADVSFQFGARFANWLNNGKIASAAAFESGVYDTSQFALGSDGHWLSPPTRTAGAQYWIPSIDEWIKAAYFDPNRYGETQVGYWAYPDMHSAPLLPGWPENGGETDAGDLGPFQGFRTNPVASYVFNDGPWGLFDISGGLQEWTDTAGSFSDDLAVKGTQLRDLFPEMYDRLDWVGIRGAHVGGFGIRIAGAVPGPTCGLVLMALSWMGRRVRPCGLAH